MKNYKIIDAIIDKDIEELTKFISNGYLYKQIDDGLDMMFVSIGCGELDIVKFLFENKYDLTRKSNSFNNNTPLDYACMVCDYEIAKFILEADKRVINNNTALIWASAEGSIELVKFLIEKGININQLDSNESNALHWAVQEGHKEIVEILIKNGCNINQIDQDGDTPTFMATGGNRFDILNILLENGAKPDLSGEDSAFQLACDLGFYEEAELLLRYGADVNYKPIGGVSELFKAYLEKDEKLISFLKLHGAKENIDNYYGITVNDLKDEKTRRKVYKDYFEE